MNKTIIVLLLIGLAFLPNVTAYDYMGYGIIPHGQNQFSTLGKVFDTERQAELYIISTGNNWIKAYDVNLNGRIDPREVNMAYAELQKGYITQQQYNIVYRKYVKDYFR